MASLIGGLAILNYGYKILSGVTTVSDTINKYMQKPEIPFADKLELKAIERRLNTLVLPLNHCIIASQQLNPASRISLNSAKELVEELIKFLSGLLVDLPGRLGGGVTTQLRYFRRELEFVSVAVLSTLSVHEYSKEKTGEKDRQDLVSLSALLKASQRLSSMTDITGNICVTKGRFFVLCQGEEAAESRMQKLPLSLMQEESKLGGLPEDKKAGDPRPKCWKQEGITAELVVSLNLVLNMYVLQIHVQDKVAATDALHMGRRDYKTKYCFYVDYDLRFRYVNAAELGLSGGSTTKTGPGMLQNVSMFPEVAKNIKNFAFHWKHTIDPDINYESVEAVVLKQEEKEYAFFLEASASGLGKDMSALNSSKELTEIDILYLLKLCAFENESALQLKEESQEKRRETLVDEIQRRKKAAAVPKQEFEKKQLGHLAARDEDLYRLLKSDN